MLNLLAAAFLSAMVSTAGLTDNLKFIFMPDIHVESEAEIQSQTVDTPEKFGHGRKELERFMERFKFGH